MAAILVVRGHSELAMTLPFIYFEKLFLTTSVMVVKFVQVCVLYGEVWAKWISFCD